nr:MAG TPA: hypothetical protein [Caudoviricetes sp.]
MNECLDLLAFNSVAYLSFSFASRFLVWLTAHRPLCFRPRDFGSFSPFRVRV